MPIRCGHCKEMHDTVAEVRDCAGVGPRRDPKEGPLTMPQQKFLGDLLRQFNCELEGNEYINTISYAAGQPIISALVDARRLKATGKSFTLPRGVRQLPAKARGERTPTHPPLPDVPEGHYAIPSRTGNNDYEFYRVDKSKSGRTYVKMIIGGHPEYNVNGFSNVRTILETIVKFGIDKAGYLYGQELQQCRHCNRSLTKYASRTLSMGRNCAYGHGVGAKWDAVQASRPAGVE
jgi:Family of unknown function (DUF6011)